MKKNKLYYIEKNSETREMVYVDFDKVPFYEFSPKVKKEDAISVNKIVFVSPTMSEKLIKKRIEKKIEGYLKIIKYLDENEDTSSGEIRKCLVDAERYKLKIIQEYVKYLGNTYASLTLEKMEVIIKKLRENLYLEQSKERIINLLMTNSNNEEIIEERNHKRR